MQRAEMRELGAVSQVQKFDRLRQFQQRRRGGQEIVRQRENGADRAVRTVSVGIVAGRLLLYGFGVSLRGRQGGADGEVCIRQRSLKCRRGASDLSVEMPERQRKLDRERQQRQPRASPDVASEPLHVDLRLAQWSNPSTTPLLYYNIGGGLRCQPSLVNRRAIRASV